MAVLQAGAGDPPEPNARSPDPSSNITSCSSSSEYAVPAPDGGWGWVVVAAVFIGNFLIDGTVGSFGLFYPELLRTFGSSPAITSMAGSLVVATYLTSSPLVGWLMRQYGCRLVTFVGGCICASGLLLAVVSDSILAFMLTYGVIGGVGMGMNSLPGHIMVNTYFNRRRGIAQGIVMSGAGFGVFAMAPLTRGLIDEYGWRGAMLISSGVLLQFCVCAMLLRPLEQSPASETGENTSIANSEGCKLVSETKEEREILEDRPLVVYEQEDILADMQHSRYSTRCYTVGAASKLNADRIANRQVPSRVGLLVGAQYSDMTSMPDLSKSHTHQRIVSANPLLHHKLNSNPFLRKDIFYSGSLYRLPPEQFNPNASLRSFAASMTMREPDSSVTLSDSEPVDKTAIQSLVYELKLAGRGVCDVSMFRNHVFTAVLLGAMLIQMGQFIPSTFIVEYSYQLGHSGAQVSVIISLYGILNIFGRLTAGSLANCRRVNSLWLCNFGTLMCAISCALFPLCRSFQTLCVFAVCFGFFIGFFPPLQVLIMVDYLGLDKLTSSVGLLQLAKGPAALVGPPLAGVAYEWTKDYGMTMEVAAVLSFLAAGIQSLVPLLHRCSPRDSTAHGMEIIINQSTEAESDT